MTAVVTTLRDQASRDRMWAAVDRLTKSSRRRVRRDDGTTIWAEVPSLWQQASLAGGGGEGGARTGVASERNLVDLDLVAARSIIESYTGRTLRGWGVDPSELSMTAQLRRLASEALIHDAGNLWWWEYRMSAWANLLATILDAGEERRPTSIRLRNAPCPICRVRQVTVETQAGPVVAPPILIDFRGGAVRAASCSHCGASWWRGDDLHALAALLAS